MRLMKSLVTGSVALGIFVAAAAGVAAVNFSSSVASDHSIVAQPAAAQSCDTRNGTDDVIVDDRNSASPDPESEPADDSRNGTSGSQDPAIHASDDSSSNSAATVAAPRTSDDGTPKGDDHGSDNRP